jgi:hypothetical protein
MLGLLQEKANIAVDCVVLNMFLNNNMTTFISVFVFVDASNRVIPALVLGRGAPM